MDTNIPITWEDVQSQSRLGHDSPPSFVVRGKAALWLEASAGPKRLAVMALPDDAILAHLEGDHA